MAARKKKQTTLELTGNSDPRAPLDAAALLAAAKPLLKTLAADLLKRADESTAVTAALQERHAKEQKAERTADAYPEWRRAFVEQVAAAWLLSCVFVRTLEDRGLLGRNRIAGPGAEDSWKAFLQLAPSLSAREYLLTVFRELTRLPAAAGLFDARHNPVWLLAPSADGARQLLDLFRAPHAETPTFRFGGDDTRFLGDLYQDLSEDVRKRYALLQTPRFVESFILDRTLEPAIELFGLDETNLIDPTCGSGHFLLGAFERLFEHRLRAEPGLSAREAATKALDAVAGADINPYAIAIARFRLTLAFIEKCGFTRLRDVPQLPLHLAVADSLIFNPHVPQLALAEGADPSQWEGDLLSFEDPVAAREVLFKEYAAVVGNPPYITVKDPALRERYREHYVSAAGKYSLAAPFAERMFQLARSSGSVGMITANSFMKREFGKKLIEQYLPSVNLSVIVNTSGAYIPGHGTPTVLLFGTADKPPGADVLTVLANRGEPTTPEDPERGLVWASIAGHWNEVGFENEYVSVARVERKSLEKHPWSLGGGGAGELKELLEERATQKLGDLAENIGFASFTGLDDAFIVPPGVGARQGIPPDLLRPMVVGEVVRDWGFGECDEAITPYDPRTQAPLPLELHSRWARFLWPHRSVAQSVASFGGRSRAEEGQNWWEWYRWQPDRYLSPFRITFAFVATHNHFALDRGGKVFSRTAPIIKLPETATEDDHLALLAYLNSSTACFWMKQVFYPKGSAAGDISKEKGKLEDNRYEFAGTGLQPLPIPKFDKSVAVGLARELEDLALKRTSLGPNAIVQGWWSDSTDGRSIAIAVDEAEQDDIQVLRRMISVQDDLDWQVYGAFGLFFENSVAVMGTVARLSQDERPFSSPSDDPPTSLTPADATVWRLRRESIAKSPELALLEQANFKRRWLGARGVFGTKVATYRERAQEAALDVLAIALEEYARTTSRPVSSRELDGNIKARDRLASLADFAKAEMANGSAVVEVMRSASVPFLIALTFSSSGVEKRSAWERTWDRQRSEDRGEVVKGDPPPKFDPKDYLEFGYWSLRGKLDVPKERFISYPGCESDEDKEPVYGWAGWDHLQRAVALAGLYQDRKQREGWEKERLKPMLAGLLELLPWLKQWHNEPSADLGGEKPCDQFEAFLNAECAEHGFTHDDLRAWRPVAKARGARKQNGKAKKAPSKDVEPVEE